VRAASWWYVGQIAVGNPVAVALGNADADADVVALALALAPALAEAGDEADDAAALDETGADDDAAAADAVTAEAGADDAGPDADDAACLLDVQAARTRLPPTMTVSARRCPMESSVPGSGTIATQRFA